MGAPSSPEGTTLLQFLHRNIIFRLSKIICNHYSKEQLFSASKHHLLDYQSNQSLKGYTALHLACLSGHVGVVGLLLSRSQYHRICLTCKLGFGCHLQVQGADHRSTELLKNKDTRGRTSLHVAATNGHHEMCLVLLGQVK